MIFGKIDAGPVLVVVAHPDDEALSCFGTLANFAEVGARIHVIFVTDGGQGREACISAVMGLIGATSTLMEFPVCCLTMDKQLVSRIEEHVIRIRPRLVITHSFTPLQHRDHSIVSQATTLACRRSDNVDVILHAEPPHRAEAFHPNLFIGIDNHFECKLRAIAEYQQVCERWFMEPEYVARRASRWSNEICNSGIVRLYEAFILQFAAVQDKE